MARKGRYPAGSSHYAWTGDKVSVKGGRRRAENLYPIAKSCSRCGENSKRIDRHHKDGNTGNNKPSNIEFLCRKCHMEIDGRSETLRKELLLRLPRLQKAAALEKKARTHCPHGHPYSGSNLYISPNGIRHCCKCRNDHKRAKYARDKMEKIK
jgi:hypothetical protein